MGNLSLTPPHRTARIRGNRGFLITERTFRNRDEASWELYRGILVGGNLRYSCYERNHYLVRSATYSGPTYLVEGNRNWCGRVTEVCTSQNQRGTKPLILRVSGRKYGNPISSSERPDLQAYGPCLMNSGRPSRRKFRVAVFSLGILFAIG